MGNRKIGEWYVTWGFVDSYVERWLEDGPYIVCEQYILVEARNEYGKVWCYHSQPPLDTEEAAQAYCQALAEDFDPKTTDGWMFARNVYGSQAYQDNWHEEEYSRMDDEERYYHGR